MIMETTKWTLDPFHSELGFKIKHLMIANISGWFRNFTIEMETEDDDFTTARIQVKAVIDSIHTNHEQRDAHLKNSDFFEADKFPELEFSSTRVEKADDETYYLHGDLTMKGITKPIRLQVEYSGVTKDPWGGERAGFSIAGKLNRSDWGITYGSILEAGGLGLGEEVKIISEIQLVIKTVAVAA